jgi:hypothetical protein
MEDIAAIVTIEISESIHSNILMSAGSERKKQGKQLRLEGLEKAMTLRSNNARKQIAGRIITTVRLLCSAALQEVPS